MDKFEFKPEKTTLEKTKLNIPKEQPKEQVPREQVKERPKEQPKAKEPSKDAIRTFLGKNISAIMRSKDKLNGKLEMVTNYELVLSINQKPVIVMKHAVDYVELID